MEAPRRSLLILIGLGGSAVLGSYALAWKTPLDRFVALWLQTMILDAIVWPAYDHG